MYVPLILFFTSLASIIFMISRKLFLLKNGRISGTVEAPFEVPHLEKVKHLTIANIKKYEHIILVNVVRVYVRSANFIKNRYQEIKTRIENKRKVDQTNHDKKEISKFLKIIGDYKQKIREITHKIKKEEDL